MQWAKIDLKTWKRAPVFQHFIQNMRCVMSLTVEMDITDFLAAVRGKQYSFYPAMMWVVSAAVNSREEFRLGYDDQGNVGIWDVVSPYYADFHPQDESFVKLVTEFYPDCQQFQQRFQADRQRYQHYRGFEQQAVPPNTFDVSCLPWVHYQSFDLHVFDAGTYLAPVITWGKYTATATGRVTLPLSLNIHHAVADGYHLCRFFADVEHWMGQI